jgi:macrolide-specific efflux system membrane fusion protein
VVRRMRGWLRRPKIVAPLVVVIVFGAASGAWAATRSSGSAVKTTTTVVAATVGPLRESVASSGTVAYATTSNLSFGANGKVTAVNVAVGNKVTAGQPLATIDSATLASNVAAAQSAVATAEARISADNAASSTTTAQLSADQAAVTAAQTQLATAQASLAQATLISPIDGTVSGITIAVGDTVGSGSSGGNSTGSNNATGATSAIQVVSTNTYTVTANVDGTQINQIAIGNQATITPSGSTTVAFGTVTSISQTASTSSSVSTYPVVITVTGTDSGLHAGAAATIAIIYRQVANAVQVPTRAIRRDTDGSSYVLVRTDGKDVKTAVTAGITADPLTQITKGLTGDEQVVVTVTTVTGTQVGNLNNLRREGFGTGGTGTGGFGGGAGGFGGGGFGGGAGTRTNGGTP